MSFEDWMIDDGFDDPSEYMDYLEDKAMDEMARSWGYQDDSVYDHATYNMMKLYKFRPLLTCCDYDRVLSILDDGFYCCSFLDFNDVNEGVFPVEKNETATFNDKLQYRICSFSQQDALQSQLMWGHYAGAGMGVAIEIDIEASDESSFTNVNYTSTNNCYDTIEKILTNKAPEWKYEAELRFISREPSEFLKLEISKIYFGTPYQQLVNYDEIKTEHRKLRQYLRRADALREECEKRSISYDDYILPNNGIHRTVTSPF